MSDSIELLRMWFSACHGVLPSEKARAQPWEVSVSLELPLAEAGRSDDLAKSIDYREIYAVVRSVLEGPSLNLVEALAEAVAGGLLRRFPMVRAVVVCVVKPEPPVDFVFGGIEVRIRREQPKG